MTKKRNPFEDLESLRNDGDSTNIVEFPKVKKTKKPRKNFAHVPLQEGWGYRVLTVAGSGAGIVAHALKVQRTTGKGDVPITAELLRKCGIYRCTRGRTLRRLVKAGMATVRYRGKGRGCPLLTLHLPEGSE
jgi:hypothetical protein